MTVTEQEIESRLKNSPSSKRLTPSHIDKTIASIEYHRFPGSTLIVCALMLRNGFYVVGESACAEPANFREDVGRDIAFKRAREKVWQLEGYLLKQELYDAAMRALNAPPLD